MYDIIVIGAGVTGCTVAKLLAENGFKVLIIEKSKLPRYKSCSGVLIKKSVELVKKYYNAEIPNSVKCTPFDNRGMIFVNDKGKEFRFEQNGVNVWRSEFDFWLLILAIKSGATVCDGVNVVSCNDKNEYVEISLKGDKLYTEQAKYVVDCEGAIGSIKSKILGCKNNLVTTYQCFYDGSINLDTHYFYAYLQPNLSEYDAWFNVKDNKLVLGVAVKESKNVQSYYNKFIDYMKKNYGLAIESLIKEDKWVMAHITPDFKIDYAKGRIFFAGEVAGFLNPMGEGISAGLECGYCVAQAIKDNFHNSDKILCDYVNLTSELKSYMIRQWHLVSLMSERFKQYNTLN